MGFAKAINAIAQPDGGTAIQVSWIDGDQRKKARMLLFEERPPAAVDFASMRVSIQFSNDRVSLDQTFAMSRRRVAQSLAWWSPYAA